MKLVKKVPRLTLFIFISLFLVVITITFFFLLTVFTEKQEEILLAKREVAVTQVEKEFLEVETMLKSLSIYIQTNLDLGQLDTVLKDTESANDMIAQMYFGMPDKTYIITSGFYPPVFDITTRPWYQLAVDKQELAYTNAYIDAFFETTVMTIVLPIYDNTGDLIGILGADIKVGIITDFISTFIEKDKGYTFLIDNHSQVIAHTNLKDNSSEIKSCVDYDIPESYFLEFNGITPMIKTNGIKGKIAYSHVATSEYIIGIFMTKAELNQNIRTLTLVSLSLITLVLAILGVTTGGYLAYISKPLKALISDINAIDLKRNSNYRLDTSQKASFREARIALNSLINMSVSYQEKLQDSLEDLSLENQKFGHLLSSTSDIVFVLDTNKKYLALYGDAISVLGIRSEDIIGNSYEEALGIEYSEERNKFYQKALNGEKVLYSAEYTNKLTNETVYLENVLNPIYNHHNLIVGVVGVSRNITEQENRYKELVYISTHDYLTGLYNRKVYDEKSKELNEKEDYPFALVNLDLNGLKTINDVYGHNFGDIALIKTAEVLLKAARKIDTVFRVSGDEFTVIMPKATKEDVKEFKEKMNALSKKTKIKNIELSIALGYYIQKDNSVSLDEAKRLAENDMYHQKIISKNANKNKVVPAILKTLMDKYEHERIHANKVKELALSLGREMGLDSKALFTLGEAAMYHDIGKVSLPEDILNKPSKLTKKEYDIIKTHTSIGHDILNTSKELSKIAIYAATHHEWYDGSGYPNGLKGDKIPLYSRIIAVAGAFEYLTSNRPYRKAISLSAAIKEIQRASGTQFDPEIVDIFVKLMM